MCLGMLAGQLFVPLPSGYSVVTLIIVTVLSDTIRLLLCCYMCPSARCGCYPIALKVAYVSLRMLLSVVLST